MKLLDTTTQGGRLQHIMNGLNLTQVELAKELKTTKATISRFINNRQPISRNMLNNIKTRYPAINTVWLEHNTGTSGLKNEIRLKREDDYKNIISNLLSEIEKLKIENNQLKQQHEKSTFNFTNLDPAN